MSYPTMRIEAIQVSIVGKEVHVDIRTGGDWHDKVIHLKMDSLHSPDRMQLLDAEEIRKRIKNNIAPTAFNGNCADSRESTGTLTRAGG